MSDRILAILLAIFAGVGVLTVVAATIQHFERKTRVKDAAPPECVHEWEPWSEPKDTNVKTKTAYNGISQQVIESDTSRNRKSASAPSATFSSAAWREGCASRRKPRGAFPATESRNSTNEAVNPRGPSTW
jgi:hypothetical protein